MINYNTKTLLILQHLTTLEKDNSPFLFALICYNYIGDNMIYPKFIDSNSTIGVCAPSDGISGNERLNRLDNAKNMFLKHNINVIETNSVRNSLNGRSASIEDRVNELEQLILDDNIEAIICASGGDFLLEIISQINFNIIKKHPKWIQGYSDPTGIIFILTTKYDIATIYSHNFLGFGQYKWHSSIKHNFDILCGKNIIQNSFEKYEKEALKYETGLEEYNLDTIVEWKSLNANNINVEGRIIGGCIDIINDLIGTPFDNINNFIEKYKKDGIIWFFDNAELSTEDLVRTMWKFKVCGYFKYTKAILFGRNINESSYYDISFKDALLTSLAYLKVPILYDIDIGHVPPRLTIINGSYAHILFENNKGEIKFEYK